MLKKQYNQLLERYYKAEKYFDRTDITEREKEKYILHFKEILNNLNYLLGEIGEYETKNILGGFKDE